MATINKKRKVDCEGRRFKDGWKLDYFFTEVRNNCVCLICKETVAVFKEYNVKRHYQKLHAAMYDKITGKERSEKLKQLEASLISQQQYFARARESNENATKASYEVAALIAKHSKPFTEGEFIKDCVMTIVKKICPEKQQEFAKVCLARNTVARRIEEVSSDIKRQLRDKGREFDFFSLACDESTDASDTAQLLIFLRGVDNEMNVTEELLDLRSLKSQTRGTDLFSSVCAAVDDMQLPWNKISGIITDGAPSMTGERSGLATLISNKVSEKGGNAVKLHCIIHQQVLCAKHLQYKHVMKPVIKTINFIRSRALCHHQFQQFLSEIHAEYGDVVYHTDYHTMAQSRFCTVALLLVDITKHLNALNTSLQGPDAVISQLYSHIKAFGTKLKLFERHLSQSQPNTAHFSALQEIMTRFPQSNVASEDFAAIEKEIAIFSSPFSVDTDDVPDHLQLELIELQCDAESRSRHQQLSLANFYRQLDKDRFREI
ncbi:general transcription factor II-I repeat domain-containing protein 2 [Larimichthys crocea]|uniref:general transcription factor II-I repeat domain-containing protein 2 n=1 Tax=Larimichthys crocea TaxID=215358 RepID=UPI000F5FFA25|nr:general transcription factor II-I repeat domain-containing protein 2-like [Larimichthys crocea]